MGAGHALAPLMAKYGPNGRSANLGLFALQVALGESWPARAMPQMRIDTLESPRAVPGTVSQAAGSLAQEEKAGCLRPARQTEPRPATLSPANQAGPAQSRLNKRRSPSGTPFRP